MRNKRTEYTFQTVNDLMDKSLQKETIRERIISKELKSRNRNLLDQTNSTEGVPN